MTDSSCCVSSTIFVKVPCHSRAVAPYGTGKSLEDPLNRPPTTMLPVCAREVVVLCKLHCTPPPVSNEHCVQRTLPVRTVFFWNQINSELN